MKTFNNTYYGFKYGNLTGKVFDDEINVSSYELDSLEGAPEIVKGNFDCSHNKLENLKYSPKEVYGDFDCSYNIKLESLEGAPEIVKGDFNCNGCSKLKSLEGVPKIVKGDFNCTGCLKLKSLDELFDIEISGKLYSNIMTNEEFRELQDLYKKSGKNMKKLELIKKLKGIK